MRAIGIILAGGRSNRMRELSRKRAVCAMPVAGSFRSIDFALTNMEYSRVQKVAVLTQFNSRSLNEHLSSSKWWDFGRKQGGMFLFTPSFTGEDGNWYRGTADAITQNIDFIDQYDPDYILILSGDHIYKMNYDEMLSFHKQNKADATIAVIGVPMKEASRFGIMNTDGNGHITEFEEKPEHPKSNLASMGIYIFSWKVLRKLLIADRDDPNSSHDFGKDIIPCLLNDGKTLMAYEFKGYWKDVGTIDSLWEANMDLLDEKSALNLDDPSWKIYTEDAPELPQYIGPEAHVDEAYITQGAHIEGDLKHSVVFTHVDVEKDAKVVDSVLMPGVVVDEGAVVTRALVANNVHIGKGAVVGSADSENILLVAKNVKGVE